MGKPDSYARHYGLERPAPKRTAVASSAEVARARELGRLPEHDEAGNGAGTPEDDAAGRGAESVSAGAGDGAQDSDDQDADNDDQGDGDGGGTGGGGRRWSMPTLGGGRASSVGAGWVLGLLLWGWVVLPFVKGGPPQVVKTLNAKFLNRASDGSQLP